MAVLEDLRGEIERLSLSELYRILAAGGALGAIRRVLKSPSLMGALHEVKRDPDAVIAKMEALSDDEEIEGAEEDEEVGVHELAELTAETDAFDFGLLDRLEGTLAMSNMGEEVIEYLVRVRVAKMWSVYVERGSGAAYALCEGDTKWRTIIRDRFRDEVEAVESLEVPAEWAFSDPRTGHVLQPNAMQKRTAHAVLTRRRVGNWSGTGAGKTLSAILAARTVNANLTVVIAANATVEQWAEAVPAVFPGTEVHLDVPEDPAPGSFVVLNYEKMQVASAPDRLEKLVALGPDFFVLDEIQFVKSRGGTVSLRREAVESLLRECPDARVLGMSATPVVNDLEEAVGLLSLITGEEQDLGTRPTIPNALAVHDALMLHGFRYVPDYAQEFPVRVVEIDGTHLADEIREAMGNGNIAPIERLLVPAKIPALCREVEPGTIVYTEFVDGVVPEVVAALEAEGHRVAVFTGEEKGGIDAFKAGEADVLVASKPVATGVDGLQRLSNKLVVLSLPWTGALYEQLVGRLRRQGSAFLRGEVVLLQVVCGEGAEAFSWDRRRWEVVQYKRTLADCAVDGVIPETTDITRAQVLASARDALARWEARAAALELPLAA